MGIQEILGGEDTHAKNEKAFDLPSRLIAKIFLFRTIFRGSGWSFANDPDFMHVSSDPSFWDEMNEKFYKKYANLDKQHKTWAELVLAGKPIEGPFGRSWAIPTKRDRFGEIKIPWTTLSNYPVQGTGADIMMVARLSAKRRIQEADIFAKWVSTVHDSIVLDIHEKDAKTIADIFDGVFADLPKNFKKLFGYDWKTPMACECKVGPNFKDLTKLK